MAGRIKILDTLLASKIAAGEVVERPASVVKELIENALDAGASSVSVEVDDGGRRLIRVIDNGEGMDRDDAVLAFRRHATSKVYTEDDLGAIQTLGFRGEALSAVSSVARVVMTTRRREDVAGTRVVVEGGAAPEVCDAGAPEGTSIEVRDLFYNTPARLKFLRSARSEFGRIAEVVRKAALARPEVRFSLVHGSSKTLDAAPAGLRERIAALFGAPMAKGLVRVETPCVSGYVAAGEHGYATSKAIYTFINGRVVRDKSVTRALMDACRGAIEPGRYPFAVLDLSVAPEDVDVNIHPAKTEVKFKDPGFVYDAVRAAVREALAEGGGRETGAEYRSAPGPVHGLAANEPSPAQSLLRFERPRPGRERYAPLPNADYSPAPQETMPGFYAGSVGAAEGAAPGIAAFEAVGTLWGEFLVAQSSERGGEFCIIDTHGAAERCAFEELKKAFYGHGEPKSQLLLLAERIETTAAERDSLNSAMDHLARFGFEIIGFGPSTRGGGESFLIKAVPAVLSSRAPARLARLVLDVAEDLGSHHASARAEEAVEAALMRIACHSVVRGATRLGREEGNALIKRLARVDFSESCPHGRPVVKMFTRREVEGFFKR